MVPAAFVRLEALPLTPNGKIDRRALPEPDKVRSEADTPVADARTPIEKILVQIWSDVLGVTSAGINDNFLDLGGHSLLASRIITRVANIFGVEITFRDFFESPTVAHMAEIICSNQAKGIDDAELVNILTKLESLSDDEAGQVIKEPGKR
jgi:hypothetical protein